MNLRVKDDGFSLVELLIVIAIIGILAVGTFTISRRPIGDVKGAMFNLRSDIAFARAEAAKRNVPILVEFISGGTDGYRICIDDQPAGAPDGVCDNDGVAPADDTMIRPAVAAGANAMVEMNQIVQFYDAAIAGGPGVAPPGGSGNVPIADVPSGISFTAGLGGPNVQLFPDGGCDENGEVFLYSPVAAAGGVQPFVLMVSQSGVSRIMRWYDGAWSTR